MIDTRISYKNAGVDIEKGDRFIERITDRVKSTYLHNSKVISGIGGFSALYEISRDRYLAAGTDGVGTKLKIAQMLNVHNTIGIDLVAMCVNDILCCGARPMFFLDYLATGSLDERTGIALIEGIAEGCRIADMALIGGETAEMPEVYSPGVYDLAGFACGEVTKSTLVDGTKIQVGDIIVGLPSTGFHSNGYSLLRKFLNQHDDLLADKILLHELLGPTRIYSPLILSLLEEFPDYVVGMAHITGGGLHNISRINSHFDYLITQLPSIDSIAPIFGKIIQYMSLDIARDKEELYRTFNMGIGFVLVLSSQDQRTSNFFKTLDERNEKYFILGHVIEKSSQLVNCQASTNGRIFY